MPCLSRGGPLRVTGTVRRVRYTVCLSVAVAVASLGLGSSSQASPPQCATDALRVVSRGGQGASGKIFAFLRFELRRPGGHCTLRGYPGVTLLNGRHRLNIHVGRYSSTLRSVLLDADHPAYFDLVYRPNTPAGRACPINVTELRIIPPNERRALPVKLRLSFCRGGAPLVQAVRSKLVP